MQRSFFAAIFKVMAIKVLKKNNMLKQRTEKLIKVKQQFIVFTIQIHVNCSIELCFSCHNHRKKMFSCISSLLQGFHPSKRTIKIGKFRRLCPAGTNENIFRIGIPETRKCLFSGNIALGLSQLFSSVPFGDSNDTYIMVQRIGDTLVVLLGKSYFIRRQKCS